MSTPPAENQAALSTAAADSANTKHKKRKAQQQLEAQQQAAFERVRGAYRGLDDLQRSVREMVEPYLIREDEIRGMHQSKLLAFSGASSYPYSRGVILTTRTRLANWLPQKRSFYAEDDCVHLLMWLAVWAATQDGPQEAALKVQNHRTSWDTATGPVAEILANIAFDRFKRHVGSRVLSAALTNIFGEPARTPGSVAFYRRLAPDNQPAGGHAEWINKQLERMQTEQQQPLPFGLVDSVGDVLFETRLSARLASGKTRRYALVPPPPKQAKYLLLLIGLEAQETANTPAPIPPEPAEGIDAQTAAVVEQLLDSLTTGMDHLKEDVHRLARSFYDQDPRRLASLNVQLWLMSRFARLLSRPEGPGASDDPPDRTRCFILEPRAQPGGSWMLVGSASSEGGPWVPPELVDAQRIDKSKLLSGYAASIGQTLIIERSDSVTERLISRFEEERGSVEASQLACIAVPAAPAIDPELPAVLYVYMSADDDAAVPFDVRARAVQVLGPVLAELRWRGRAAETAIRSCSQVLSLSNRWRGEKCFKRAFNEEVKTLLKGREDKRPSKVDPDERLALIIVKAIPGRASSGDTNTVAHSPLTKGAADWLASMLPKSLQPFQLLAEFRAHTRDVTAVDRAVWGTFGDGIAILIPHRLPKSERDRLRQCVSMRLNALSDGVTDEGQPAVRLAAWIVDERCPRGTKHEEFAANLWAHAKEAEQVLAEVVAADQEASAGGNWAKARSYIARAHRRLEELGTAASQQAEATRKDPVVAYLYRRDAEFALRSGGLAEHAEQLATEAVKLDKASVTARCLLADALLAQGQPGKAIAQLDEWLKENHEVAPYEEQALLAYHKSFALLAPALALQQHVHDLLREAATVDRLEQLRAAQRVIDVLTRAAASSFEQSGSLSLSGSFAHTTTFRAMQAELLSGAAARALNRLDVAANAYPRDVLVSFEQLWMRMWASNVFRDLLLNRPGELEQLAQELTGKQRSSE